MTPGDFPHAFRMKFWPWIIFGWVACNVSVLGILAVTLALGPAQRPPAWVIVYGYAAGWVFGTPFLAIGVGLYVVLFRVRVGPGGLRGYDFWSLPAVVSWDGITDLRPLSLVGLPFLLIQSDVSRRRLWLPLFLADYPGFVEAVAESAGDDHPLTVALKERLIGYYPD